MHIDLAARWLANNINPFLVGIWICFLVRRSGPKPVARFGIVSVAAMLIAITLAELGKHHRIWHHSPTFPSGHETIGSSFAASIFFAHRGLGVLAIAACVILAVSMVYVHYHHVSDALAGALLGGGLVTTFLRAARLNRE